VGDSRIVDQDIEAAEFLADPLEEIGNAVVVADIAWVRKNFDSLSRQLCFNAAKSLGIAAAYNELATFLRQRPGNCMSNALGCAGDQRDFVVKYQEKILTAEIAEKTQMTHSSSVTSGVGLPDDQRPSLACPE
jgi:hypothetical protein